MFFDVLSLSPCNRFVILMLLIILFGLNYGFSPIFTTVNSTSTPGSYADDSTSTSLNQAQDIKMSGFTLTQQGVNIGLSLQSCRNSSFDDIKITGTWVSGNVATAAEVGISLTSLSTAVSSNDNYFSNCEVYGFTYGVFSDFDIKDNMFENMKLRTTKASLGSALGAAIAISDTKLNSKFLKKNYALKKHVPFIVSG